MNMEKPRVTFTSTPEIDPSNSDPALIEQTRNELLTMDTEGKLFIAPNQTTKSELEMWQIQLFEIREDLDGKSAYDYFDKIIFGHGEGPTDIDQRSFKGANELSEEYQGTIGNIKQRIGTTDKKVLTVVCGTKEEDKMTLTKAIRDYLK